jgi:hypothetical protein
MWNNDVQKVEISDGKCVKIITEGREQKEGLR